ncbi:DNA gyrase subunit A, partial [Bacillus sp. WP8]|uniref:DNA gyrase subunit A n=1 Tax=Bacillus sp. WP8 TaxID=756828 RepID=UPI0028CB772D
LNNLYKQTTLQTSFAINLFPLLHRHPKLFSLKQCLQYYLHHQKVIIPRRTPYQLPKPEPTPHILQPLTIPLDHLHQLIPLITTSQTAQIPTNPLIHNYTFSQKQPHPILHIPLHPLTPFQTQNIQQQYKPLLHFI